MISELADGSLLDYLPDDVFLHVRRAPDKDVGVLAGVTFSLLRVGSPVTGGVYFWTNEFKAGNGLYWGDLQRKMEKLLRAADHVK